MGWLSAQSPVIKSSLKATDFTVLSLPELPQ
jgi:hypothetical protein